MNNSKVIGHAAALFTTSVWGITYVSTKYLVGSFSPVEILMIRFCIAVSLLKLFVPQGIRFELSKEPFFALAGFSGICMYFVLENTALTITSASNVGIIVATAPLFTGILAAVVFKDRQVFSWQFILGFMVSITGIVMLSLKGSDFSIHPEGDLLVICAGIFWAVYSLTIKKICSWNFNNIAVTRRAFLWGMLFITPFMICSDLNTEDLSRYTDCKMWMNLLFLGAVASAVCFASWNFAVKTIGAVKTSVYIYSGPAVTVIFAYFFLGEQLNITGICGCILATAGLVISSLRTGNTKTEEQV